MELYKNFVGFSTIRLPVLAQPERKSCAFYLLLSLFNSVFVFFLSTSLHAVEYGPSLNLRPLNNKLNAFGYHASPFPHNSSSYL